MEGEGRTKGGTADAPSPVTCHDHESQDDLPPEEKGNPDLLFRRRFNFFILAAQKAQRLVYMLIEGD